MANEFIARKGLIVPSGSILVATGSITASNFVGTASYAETASYLASDGIIESASYAETASYALNAGQGAGFPYSGSAVITGSLYVVSGSELGGVTGSFTGSFAGEGSGLQNVPAAVIIEIDGGFADTQFDETNIIFDGGGA